MTLIPGFPSFGWYRRGEDFDANALTAQDVLQPLGDVAPLRVDSEDLHPPPLAKLGLDLFHQPAFLRIDELLIEVRRLRNHKALAFAAVTGSRLGVRHIHLSNAAVRDYFYFSNRRRPGCEEQTLFDLLGTVPSAGPVDLRLALKVRLLELQTDAAPKDQLQAVERAFNLLARPDLRSCYQALLGDRDAPRYSLTAALGRCSLPVNSRQTGDFSPRKSYRSSRIVGSGDSVRLSGKSSSSMAMPSTVTADEKRN